MNIKDQVFTTPDGSKVGLRLQLIELLRGVPSASGVETARKQKALYERLEECTDEFELSPEEAVLCREIINRVGHLPCDIQIGLHDALDPQPESE